VTKPEEITWEDVATEGATGKQYVPGKDKTGRAVMVMRPVGLSLHSRVSLDCLLDHIG
jgi:hypothetical protein